MSELLLAVIIIALIAERAFNNWLDRRERRHLLYYKISKDAADLRSLEIADKTEVKTITPIQNDFISESEATEEEWEAAIKKEVEDEDGR